MRPTHRERPSVAPDIVRMDDKALRYRDAVGPLPTLSDPGMWDAA